MKLYISKIKIVIRRILFVLISSFLFMSMFSIHNVLAKDFCIEIKVNCESEGTDEIFEYHMSGDKGIVNDSLNLSDGQSDVFKVTFNHIGHYQYLIQQNIGTNTDINYEDTVYHVDVEVTYGDNQELISNAVVYQEGSKEKLNEITYHNIKLSKTNNIHTGDTSNLYYYLLLLIVSFVIVLLLYILRHLRKGDKSDA